MTMDLFSILALLLEKHQEFLALLKEESKLLMGIDIEALDALVLKKNALIELLEHSESILIEQIGKNTLPIDREIILLKIPMEKKSEAQDILNQLTDLILECRDLNIANYSVVQTSLVRTKRKLEILAYCLKPTTHIYDKNGVL
jgi:flagellar biosynthesis/type III secretory pathway chaperone